MAGSAQATTSQATTSRASVNEYGWKLTYQAGAGQANKITASLAWNQDKNRLVYQIDDSVPVEVGNGCSYLIDSDHTSVRCEVEPVDSQDPYAALKMNLLDKDDVVKFHNNSGQVYYFSEFWLGAGKDTLDSSVAEGPDGGFVWGQGGPDRITTGRVATVQGGTGADALTTSGNYSDLDGGPGNDKLWGGLGAQYLRGGTGDDVVHGGGGKDTLYGEAGDDRLYGEQSADALYGNGGDDYLNGGKGTDKLSGGPGKDVLKP